MKKILLKQWLNDWYTTYKKPFIKTHKNIEINIRLHIPDNLKNKTLDKILPIDIQNALQSVERSKTRKETFDIYNGSLRIAFELGYISRNPCNLVIKPKHERKKGNALTADEFQKFLEKAKGHRAEKYFLFCIYTGCRRSEGLRVCWSDIDFNNKTIRLLGTKTGIKHRVVPLLEDCEKLLMSISQIDNKVFHHRADYLSKSFKKLCPVHKLHDLRHTYATKCLQCDVSLKVASEWLGHSSVVVTANTYMHITNDIFKKESKKINFGQEMQSLENKKS